MKISEVQKRILPWIFMSTLVQSPFFLNEEKNYSSMKNQGYLNSLNFHNDFRFMLKKVFKNSKHFKPVILGKEKIKEENCVDLFIHDKNLNLI
jgi:hypothetical protein